MGNVNSTITSYALFSVLAAAAVWYYYPRNQAGRSRARGRSLLRANNTTTGKGEPIQWSDSESKKPTKAKAPRKTVKKAVQEAGQKAEAYLSNASTTGADADDDLSPVASPTLNATQNAPSGRDVSDMLEAKAPSASVLSIKPSEKPGQQKKPQPQRQETPQETKKQRQNRRKAEEAKQQREADEKERQKLLEKQRRTAREARGEPAKNGLQPAKAPSSNAWTAGRPAPAVTSAPAHNGQLLDTFDPDVVSTASSSEAGATNGTAPTPDSMGNSREWASNLSEEEQIRILTEDTTWNEVKGKKQRKNKQVEDTTDDGTDTGTRKEAAPVKPAAVKAPAKQENRQPSSRFAVLDDTPEPVGHSLDSDWTVA
jgi:hypothetical protein